MSCPHGNPDGGCDLCDEKDAAWDAGAKSRDVEIADLKKAYESAFYEIAKLRAIQEAAFNAGRAEGGKDAGWLPIETAPTEGREMFVVKAFNVCNGFTGGKPYTSDPWCVWHESDSSFARWNHKFQPTHWMPLPPPPAATPTKERT